MSDPLLNTPASLAKLLPAQSRYLIEVHDCPHFLDVLSFQSIESLSQPWRYHLLVTCTHANISCESLLLKPGCFTLQTPMFNGAPAVPLRRVFGVVQSFRQLDSSADETRYALTLVPRIALMQHTCNSAIFLNQSVIEVVEKVLRKHGLEGPDFEFHLSRDYPARELITQWQENDLAFVQRLLAEVGVFWRFAMDSRLELDVVIFHDSQQHYQFGVRLPLRDPAGMNDSGQESLWDIRTAYQVVTGRVANRDYNYRQALTPQDSMQSLGGPQPITTGEIYHYAEPFLSEGDPESTESGAFYARLRHERILNAQYAVSGQANSPLLVPGQVLETDASLPTALKDGIVITSIRCRGSRQSSFSQEFTGIPYSEILCYRPACLKRPVISGSLPARIESAQPRDSYAWLDDQGRYRVKLDFDRNSSEPGYAYLWLRMAKPYAGDTYGWHAPLLDGTEVSIIFDNGDPDRPYIAYAQHDSEHPDPVTRDNHTRNIWRTPANNKLRMEDKRQEEHIKLATEYGKSQLNLGHLVNERREPRGTGFELRTDESGAVRAGKGLFLSADKQPKAQGPMLEMTPAINLINQANSQMQSLHTSAEAAKALLSDLDTQMNFVSERLKDLRAEVVLASAPQGLALVSGEHLQLTSRGNTMINAGQHLDIGAMKNLSLCVAKALGLFVCEGGAKLVANQGDIEILAQHNTLALFAEQQITVTSKEDEIVISTPKTLTLNGGGSYLKLSANGIEHGSQGNMVINAATYLVPGGGDKMDVTTQTFEKTTLAPSQLYQQEKTSN